jgi:hypothetical protein
MIIRTSLAEKCIWLNSMVLNLTIMKTWFHIWSQNYFIGFTKGLTWICKFTCFLFQYWTFVIWFNWIKIRKWFNSNFSENFTLLIQKIKNIVLSSIQFKNLNSIWLHMNSIEFELSSIQWNSDLISKNGIEFKFNWVAFNSRRIMQIHSIFSLKWNLILTKST